MNKFLQALVAVTMLLSTIMNGVAAYKLTAMKAKVEDIFCIPTSGSN
jgi:hypothetical protein